MTLTRFAPSPTGYLHIGNVRTALFCYLFAKKKRGKFMLRLDDTDRERSEEKYVEQIKDILTWLGLKWDILSRQSERFTRYEEVKQHLIKSGRLYPCFETAEELEMKRKMQLGRGLPPIYDRTALQLNEQQKEQFIKQGKKPHWRFRLDENATIQWDDLVMGPTHFEAKNLSDPILIRENGSYTYMLPSVIDDADFAITNIIRGNDHVTNTAIQIQIFQALSASIPTFAHHPLMTTKNGKISKRKGGFSLESLKEEGIEPMAINSFLAKLGTSDAMHAIKNMQELIDGFNLKDFGKSAVLFDIDDLKRVNMKIVHQLEFDEVKHKLAKLQLNKIDAEFWNAVRANLNTIEEIATWWNICKEPITPQLNDEDMNFTKTAAQLLPDGTWNKDTFRTWIEDVKKASDRKGKDLFMPLRKALTSMDHGPELKDILPLIGKEKALARLNGSKA